MRPYCIPISPKPTPRLFKPTDNTQKAKAAKRLSQILAQSDDAALLPLKEELYNNLMTSEKALSPSQ
jgi:hypothetical protein